MVQRTGEPRVLRSRSSRVIPPSSSQTEDTSAPAADARSDKQDFLDSILSSMQEQHYDNNLSLERVLQMCAAHESAANTQRDLHGSPAMAMAVGRAPKATVCYSPRTS